jgi:hypothetical protein
MCEYNRPYPVPYGQHPDDRRIPEIQIQSREAWQRRLGQLPLSHIEVINKVEQEAAATQADVHLHRSKSSSFLGISLEPGTGPNVKIWEH